MPSLSFQQNTRFEQQTKTKWTLIKFNKRSQGNSQQKKEKMAIKNTRPTYECNIFILPLTDFKLFHNHCVESREKKISAFQSSGMVHDLRLNKSS